MLTSHDTIGRCVIRPNGELLGVVTDLVVDYRARRVLALRVEVYRAGSCGTDLWADETVVLPLEAVYDLQPDYVMITNRDDLVAISRLPLVQAASEESRARSLTLGQAPLHDRQGGLLGRLAALRFDPDSGALLAFEMKAQDAGPCGTVVLSAAQVDCIQGTLIVSPVLAALLAEVAQSGEPRFPGAGAAPA